MSDLTAREKRHLNHVRAFPVAFMPKHCPLCAAIELKVGTGKGNE